MHNRGFINTSLIVISVLLLGLVSAVSLVKQRQELRKKASSSVLNITLSKLNPELKLDFKEPVNSFLVDGTVTLGKKSSHLRLILIDQKDEEYLIYEAFPLLTDQMTFTINDSCEETCLLNKIIPVKLRIESDAFSSFKLDKFSFTTDSQGQFSSQVQERERLKIEKVKIDKLNQQIRKRG